MSANQIETERKMCNSGNVQRTQMQKDMITQKLRENGCRITKQRMLLLDIILSGECSCCKEIYYKASKKDGRIGPATVYRMVNILEEIGAISRKNMYKIACGQDCGEQEACRIELSDHTTFDLSARMWNKVIQEGLKNCGYIKNQEIRSVTVTSDTCG